MNHENERWILHFDDITLHLKDFDPGRVELTRELIVADVMIT